MAQPFVLRPWRPRPLPPLALFDKRKAELEKNLALYFARRANSLQFEKIYRFIYARRTPAVCRTRVCMRRARFVPVAFLVAHFIPRP